jgi:hypothetical protein
MTGSVHTIQATDASVVCADGHVAYTKCTCTTLSFLLDHFFGLLDGLSCCHYGGHLAAALVLSGAGWMMMMVLQGGCRANVMMGLLGQNFWSRLYVCAGTASTCARWVSECLFVWSLLLGNWGSVVTGYCLRSWFCLSCLGSVCCCWCGCLGEALSTRQ